MSGVSDDLQMATPTDIDVTAPFAGVIVAIHPALDARVRTGAPLVTLEAMKMEHEVLAESSGVLGEMAVAVGDAVEEGQLLLRLTPAGEDAEETEIVAAPTAAGERDDLRAVRERHEIGLDAARGEAIWFLDSAAASLLPQRSAAGP